MLKKEYYLLITFFLSSDFNQLWGSVISICLFAEVKQLWAMLVMGWCTTHVFDGFLAQASRPKPLSACFFFCCLWGSRIVAQCDEYLYLHSS